MEQSILMDKEAQHSTKLRPFDPSHHGADVAQSFDKFIRLYKRKYAAWDRNPPTGIANVEQWKGRDKLKQLLGHYSSDRFMDDVEAVATEAELDTMPFEELIDRLKARYKPNTNQTMAHYNFHRLSQLPEQSFDSFLNQVKNETKKCNFKCANVTCNVSETLIRDQLIIGVKEEEFRKTALKEEWNLAELEDQGRRSEAACLGAAALAEDGQKKVDRVAGKYSKLHRRRETSKQGKKDNSERKPKAETFRCYRCNRDRCNTETCPAKKSLCHTCNVKGHWSGSVMCSGKSQSSRKRASERNVKAQYVEESSSASDFTADSDTSDSDSEQDTHRLTIKPRRYRGKPAFRVKGVRHRRVRRVSKHDF